MPTPRAIEFRRWATDVLKRYLLKGVPTNERRLRELDSLVQALSRSSDQLISGVAEVVARYLPGLRTLRDYDEGEIPTSVGDAPTWTLIRNRSALEIVLLRSELEGAPPSRSSIRR